MKTLVIVPAYNEAANISNVIDSVSKADKLFDILVVNDGSTDNTGQIAESTGKAFVINLPCNLGIGGGVQTGFKFAVMYDYDIALQFDGDGQHNISEISKLLSPIRKDEADVVIGSRFCEKNHGFRSTRLRRVGIRIFEFVNSILIKQKITDNTSGFRAYNKKTIKFLAENYPLDYPEPEAVILLGKNGFRLKEVSVIMDKRQGGKSSISGLTSFYYMVKVLLSIFVNFCRPCMMKR